ncbi:response regulator transcription factor [Inconstantimicrobium mannanitabidum]|uniref:DNA-binding response regulator n=1 Tax=Inconstantimicrobium mannanitabidum TaxID=1604901 RepID=A0ACB5R892_9CLOT|nr:response regulator transcription factor [Clostridium sp. TW13]GKX65246.1 DNA-binding response regulator [Clostridium sp. TW13]
MFTILIVEDDIKLRKLFSTVLNKNGYNTLQAGDGIEAWNVIEANHVDLVISDIMMPNMDGYEFTKSIRDTNSEIPILMITAREDFSAKRRGFILGTDDYMVKPIDVNEMVLRVGALLRRVKSIHDRKQNIGETILDYDCLTVFRNGEIIELSQKEFYLLYMLVSFPNKIFTRQQLMDEIWGVNSESDAQTIDVHINRLRKHFSSNPDFEIVTVRGLGYKVVKK